MANVRIKHAKIERENDHYILVFQPDAATIFKWDWQGNKVLYLNGDSLGVKHFSNIDKFEGWCRRYSAEN